MMQKFLSLLLLAAVCQLGAATNYALRSNGSGFAGKVQASRAIDGKVNTYWGFDPYPKGFTLQLKNIYNIDKLKIVFYKTGVYTFKAEYSTDNVN
ncbi:MAG: discoidin domain-containing protein, partial [Lentisphaeria bacterium]|nr:discoidin domain-containing protein [Lentisphaeria bacterium]